MIKIEELKNHQSLIPTLAKIWQEGIGKFWFPEIDLCKIEEGYFSELTSEFPLTFVSILNSKPVGSCTFSLKEEFSPNYGPWITDLVVDTEFRNRGIGKALLQKTIQKIHELGYKKIHLFTFEQKITRFYQHHGWIEIDKNIFNLHPITILEFSI